MGREVWTLQDKVLLVCYGSLYVGVLCALAGAPSPWLSGKLGPDRWLDQIPVVVATFVAAAAGGWAAFTAERRTREEAERKSRISAANKALFVIATMFNVFDNLRQFYIDAGDFRRSPNRVLMIDSPQPGMMQPLNFDFDSLNYFLEPDGDVSSMALMELQTLDWHYHLLVNTVELRASATEELHKAIKRAASAAFIDAEAAKGLAPSEYFKSEAPMASAACPTVLSGRLHSRLRSRTCGLYGTGSARSWRRVACPTPFPPRRSCYFKRSTTLKERLRTGPRRRFYVEGDVGKMHGRPEYSGALFQVASQFNLLKMIGPSVTPEDGVTRYESDRTQGPACAIAAGAATIYGNYFALS